MRTKLFLLGFSIFLLSSINAKAICDTRTHLMADGRVLQITLAADQDAAFWFSGRQGHSYSVEVSALDGTLSNEYLGTAAEACPSSNASGVTVTSTNDPVIIDVNTGFRGSFTATSAGTPYYTLRVVNSSSASLVEVAVSDTTMYNPRWSTIGGYTTQWGFQNTSAATVTCNLIITTTAGGVASDTTFDVAPGVVVFKTSTALSIAAGQSGSALFTYNGPPGSIEADAYMVSSGVTTVVPTKFEPVRSLNH